MALSGGGLTVFSIPKGFEGHTGVIQRNAVASWTHVPGASVLLFGEEIGLAEAASELGVTHIKELRRNEMGTPLVGDAFDQARQHSRTPALAFANGDIMFTPGLSQVVAFLLGSLSGPWLAVGRRWDIDIGVPWSFEEGWEWRLGAEVTSRGVLHGASGIDYFVFPRDFGIRFPPLAVGRPGWDNWLIAEARRVRMPVIDLTDAVLCVHQNHPPRYVSNGVEARQNLRSAGGHYNLATIRDATHRMGISGGGTYALRRSVIGAVAYWPPVRALLTVRRTLVALVQRRA